MAYHTDRDAARAVREEQLAGWLTEGLSHRECGQRLGISGPAISHFVSHSPRLRRIGRQRAMTRRRQLRALRDEVAMIRRDLSALMREIADEEASLDIEEALAS